MGEVVTIDCAEIKTREELHEALSSALGFPDWYGRNLDALYDLLTENDTALELRFLHFSALESSLGSYARRLVRVLRDAEEERFHLFVRIEA